MDYKPLSRAEIAKILKRHKGQKSEVARRASVGSTLVSHWLKGRSISANVAHHAEVVARELLAKEEIDRLAKGEANGPSVRKVIEDLRKAIPPNGIIKKATGE